ncbi:MAG: arylsulfatase [Desulfobacterales bacterium]|nr:arylsulfatase [Desulfobacteraceae bacterium]MDH3836659.1 arylsulfatase [Desulfobacteraceae bacterium]MDH3876068.1 arylsulfatase [Desulfobacteraceae bacterium]MDH3884403.1 arylsulfatase [Desulfobacterales bacterium]
MKRMITLSIIFIFLFFCSSSLLAKERMRPNILLIVVDDMGYSDIGPFGGEVRTPSLDSLAKSGMRFTDFHTSVACSPTRSMLLSGTDNHLAGMGNQAEALFPNQLGKPGYEGHLNDRVVSFATLLRNAGYFTAMAGKWHLGEEVEHDPYNRGFQKAYALLQGGASHFDTEWMMCANYTPIYRENGVRVHVPKGFYSTEFYTDKIIEYIDSRDANKPFFAYLSYTAPHDPLHVPDEWLEKYKGRYDKGYEVLREERLNSLKKLEFIPKDAVPFPRLSMIPDWEDLPEEQRKIEARRMELYSAMIENVDHHMGRLFKHLKKTGDYDNTLIIFFSDNGANGNEMHQYPDTDKAWLDRNSDNRYENMGRRFSRIAAGPAWAQVSMTPFRLFKGFTTEGGIRSPLIISGPGVVKPGTRSDAFAHVMDISATILEVAGVDHPGTSYKGRKVEPLLGRSMLKVLNGKSDIVYDNDTAVNWELIGFRAVRKGEFKLVWLPVPFGNDDWQLYDLSKDPAEMNDLSKELPKLRKEMISIWNRYSEEVGVVLPPGGAMRMDINLPSTQ